MNHFIIPPINIFCCKTNRNSFLSRPLPAYSSCMDYCWLTVQSRRSEGGMNTHRSTHLSRSLLPSFSIRFCLPNPPPLCCCGCSVATRPGNLGVGLFMAMICESSLPFPSLASTDSTAVEKSHALLLKDDFVLHLCSFMHSCRGGTKSRVRLRSLYQDR